MLILHIAEKPSVANALAKAFSEGRTYQVTEGGTRYNKLYIIENSTLLPRIITGPATHRITSVSGHTHETDFEEYYKRWDISTIPNLFNAPLVRSIKSDSSSQINFIKREARAARYVVLWLDPDREGEFISFTLLHEIGRGSFIPLRCLSNSLTSGALVQAWMNPINPEQRKNIFEAAQLRNSIDFRLGAIFSRWQTLTIKSKYPVDQIFTFGQCQIPTLCLVVNAFNAQKNFVPEQKFTLKISFSWIASVELATFRSKTCALLELYNLPSEAEIGEVVTYNSELPPPSPINSVDLQKALSSQFSASMISKAAESLYLKGLMSYPRTETQNYTVEEADETYQALLSLPGQLGAYASSLSTDPLNRRRQPIPGPKNDNSHSALRILAPSSNLTNPVEKQVYNYVAKHNLIEMSQNAVLEHKNMNCLCGKYNFNLNGTKILLKTFLELDNTVNVKSIPNISSGRVPLKDAFLDSGMTSGPGHLTERRLISIMDKKEIGTDATIPSHIENIISRKYAERRNGYIFPTNLGLVLISAYFNLGFAGDKLIRPEIRAQFERDLKRVENGQVSARELEHNMLTEYSNILNQLEVLSTKSQFLSFFRNLT